MRFALRKAPDKLTDRQRPALARIQQTTARLYRAYVLNEQLRQLYHLDDWCGRGERSHLPPQRSPSATLVPQLRAGGMPWWRGVLVGAYERLLIMTLAGAPERLRRVQPQSPLIVRGAMSTPDCGHSSQRICIQCTSLIASSGGTCSVCSATSR